MKRFFDIIFASIGILVLMPVLVIISILILVTDRGPIFFRQKRVGKNGISFTLLKFRSMNNSIAIKIADFEPGNLSRITVIGRFLRKTKLDELPQLFNILKGDMSIVGPRPEVEKWVAEYPEKWEHVLKIRPGLTDNASIEFRNEEFILADSEDPEKTYREEILPRKLELYAKYVDNQSFMGDIKLILKTLFVILPLKPI